MTFSLYCSYIQYKVYAMPSIRHRCGAVFRVAQPVMDKTHMVEIIARDGSLVLVIWLGFICNAGTRFLNGGLAKMKAFQISREDGSYTTQWTQVPEGEYVLCWRVPHNMGTAKCGVYAIVDDFGMPITSGSLTKNPLRSAEALAYVTERKWPLKLIK